MLNRLKKLIFLGVLSAAMLMSHTLAFAAEETQPVTETETQTETEPPQTETKAPETQEPETQPPQTETKAPETQTPETQPPQTETKAPETQAPETRPETQAPTEAQTEAPAQTEPVQDPSLHITDGTGVTANIVGFSVDPSKYPAANVSENTVAVYEYLTSVMGLNHAGACGVLANIQLESDFSPLSLGDGGSSYGICQWHNERFNRLISFCNGNGLDYNTLGGQLKYLESELASSYPSVLAYIRSVPDTAQGAYDAAYYWCVHFEVPDHTSERAAQRGNLAMNEYYGKTFVSSPSTDPAAVETIKDVRGRINLENRLAKIRISNLIG